MIGIKKSAKMCPNKYIMQKMFNGQALSKRDNKNGETFTSG